MVKIAIPGTLLNKKPYEEMVNDLHVEPEESSIMGSFVFENIVMGDEPGHIERRQPKSKKEKERTQEKVASQ